MTTPSAAQSSACIRASNAAASIGTFDSTSWVTSATNAIIAVASINENNVVSARWRSTDTAVDKTKMATSVRYCPSAITPAPISMLIAPTMGCPRAVSALFQIGLASTPKGIIWMSIHMAGTAANNTMGLAIERKNEVSPGRMVRKRTSIALAAKPATRLCAIGPSKSNTAGEAQMRATRRRRAYDTSIWDFEVDQRLKARTVP